MSKEVMEKVIQLMTVAFGLVATLAWNDAIQTLFTEVFGAAGSLADKFAYAALVTAVVVFVTIRLGRISERLEAGEDREN